MAKEKVFLYRCPTPTCIVCRNWGSNFSMLGPRQLAHFCKLTFRQLLYWGPRQLALFVGIGDPISLCWGPANLHIFVC
ncbi:hypothetical protein B8A18_04040 [Staphylococcus aureus]|nr:hypothetical protein B7983_01245 [Staphylococcus aureus]ORN56896.1 hypothetical protein B8A19_12910 [Staphylococcus aureus]ORN66825.1 hypothetical protein B8A18_04040 [Staphylococcus aureus]ORN71490.1 hypothetical protein B8A17_01565 [Staphylococcus aureus]